MSCIRAQVAAQQRDHGKVRGILGKGKVGRHRVPRMDRGGAVSLSALQLKAAMILQAISSVMDVRTLR